MNYKKLLDIATTYPKYLVSPGSWVGHTPFAAWVIDELAPDIFVELGTHAGNSYFAFCQRVKAAGLSTKCFAVDSWEGDSQAGYYSEEVYERVKDINDRDFAEFSSLLRLPFDEAVNHFADGSIGLLHIDGLHTKDAVQHDFTTWLPKLRPGAVVLFHDIEARHDDFGVYQVWEELRDRFTLSFAFLHSWGLGVLQLPPGEGKEPWSIFTDPELRRDLRRWFTAIGSDRQQVFDAGEAEKEKQRIEMELREHIEKLLASEHDLLVLRNTLREHKNISDELLRRKNYCAELERYNTELIAHVEKEKKEMQAQIDQYRACAQAATERYETLEASTIWQFTAPLRAIVDLVTGKKCR